MKNDHSQSNFCCDLSELPIVLRVNDLQRILGIGRNAAYKLVHSGRIKSLRAGSRILIPRTALIEFLSGTAA